MTTTTAKTKTQRIFLLFNVSLCEMSPTEVPQFPSRHSHSKKKKKNPQEFLYYFAMKKLVSCLTIFNF